MVIVWAERRHEYIFRIELLTASSSSSSDLQFKQHADSLINKQDMEGALDEVDILKNLQIESLVNQYKCPTRIVSN